MSPSKPAPNVPVVYLALGSNLGNRRAHLSGAVAELRAQAGAELVSASALYATEAVGIADGPEFLNAAIGVRTALSPAELLKVCLAIEISAGRIRGGAGSPNPLAKPRASSKPAGAASAFGERAPPTSRPLDLDLLIWAGVESSTPELILPHPRIHERAFVLAPLAEIAPEALLGGRTIAAWAAAVGSSGIVRLPGTEDWARPDAA